MFGKRATQKPGVDLVSESQKEFSHVIAEPFLTQAPLEYNDAKLRNPPIFPLQQVSPKFIHPPADLNVVENINDSVHSPAGDLLTPNVQWDLASAPWIWARTVNVQPDLQKQQQSQPQPPSQPQPQPQPQPHGHAMTATRGVAVLESQHQRRLFQNIEPFAASHILQSDVSFGVDSDYDPPGTSTHRDSYTSLSGHLTQPLLPVVSGAIDRTDFPSKPETPFRYRVTLHAPTAIRGHSHEPPVTYLNKHQIYSISIADTSTPAHVAQPVRYRTSLRITFEEVAHRTDPARCWRLWKEVRGAVEAQQRGGKMRALEFVDLRMGSMKSTPVSNKADSASFDGFCVTWTGTPEAGCSECVVNVRLNFLSTDFSVSKGVKGVPTRLCVKTEMIGLEDGMPAPGVGNEAEICYCKVKVFREHGAERKLSNDMAHVRKVIHKVERQIAQRGIGGKNHKDLDKRKHQERVGHRVTKNTTVSMSLSSIRSNHMRGMDDLSRALFELRKLSSSSQPTSVLSLQGNVLDDLDQSPVFLAQDFSTPMSLGGASTSVDNADGSFHSSPVEARRRPFGRTTSTVEPKAESPNPGFSDIQSSSSPESDKHYILSCCQHVACFYVRFLDDKQQEPYYRAIYLRERTTSDFICQLSRKYKVQPDRILSLVHIKPNNLYVIVDDDVVGEIPEGQDILARFTEVSAQFNSDGRDGTEGYRNGYEVHLVF